MAVSQRDGTKNTIKEEDESLQYKEIQFGKDENKISITLLNEMMEQRLAGMISSPLFKENIAIVITENPEDDDYSFACLGCGKDGAAPRVAMTKELYDERKIETPMAKTVVLHEVGHYYNSDIGNNEDNSDERRRKLVANNEVCLKEIKADAFAVEYLGKETVISGLETLKHRILDAYKDYDEESVELLIKEIDIRINIILKEELR